MPLWSSPELQVKEGSVHVRIPVAWSQEAVSVGQEGGAFGALEALQAFTVPMLFPALQLIVVFVFDCWIFSEEPQVRAGTRWKMMCIFWLNISRSKMVELLVWIWRDKWNSWNWDPRRFFWYPPRRILPVAHNWGEVPLYCGFNAFNHRWRNQVRSGVYTR